MQLIIKNYSEILIASSVDFGNHAPRPARIVLPLAQARPLQMHLTRHNHTLVNNKFLTIQPEKRYHNKSGHVPHVIVINGNTDARKF